MSRHTLDRPDHGALNEAPLPIPAQVEVLPKRIRMRSGVNTIELVIDDGAGNPRPLLSFLRGDEWAFSQRPRSTSVARSPRRLPGPGGVEVHQVFASDPDEKFYGLGQHAHPHLDHKGPSSISSSATERCRSPSSSQTAVTASVEQPRRRTRGILEGPHTMGRPGH